MGRPGVIVTSKAARPARGQPTDNGAWFVSGMTERGPIDQAVEITSLDQYTTVFGDRVSYGYLYDALEAFFAEGGATAYVSRVVGPGATTGLRTLVDRAGTPLNTLRINAAAPGAYSTRLSVAVQNGTPANTFTVIVYFDDIEVERFSDLANPGAAVAAIAGSAYVTATDLASATAAPNNNPAVLAKTALSAGNDDRGSATDATDWGDALDVFTRDLGPGQVSAPGRSSVQVQTDLISHAMDNNRTAYLDTADVASKATLTSARDALKALQGAEYAGLFGSWVNIPGLSSGTTRAVPGSAFAAGVTSRTDGVQGTSGAAPAGEAGSARYALSVRTPAGGLSEADYEALNDAGVNMTRSFIGRGVQLYGFRSVTDDADWLQLTATRLRVSLTARLEAIAALFVFRSIDGRGQLFGELNGALAAECLKDFNAGALYGATPDDAFTVVTDDSVNTSETIAAGEIHADVYARFSPFAELVRISIVKVPITAPVAS